MDNQTLYFNYDSLYEIIMMLKKIKILLFKIQINFRMDKKYIFYLLKKILYLK
ncbi:hypothetical protein RS022_00580 [Candidatus Phytoplasma rubi]|uniref:Uncharacterized protein n=1 Tax=Candidatus Phytoplasma rubi TaxID=399025 RepID=A0ABY7BQL7_9MOLU|nr:hypothetical protein RS022_00580 [Candidatus Phytoplasma rubi]